MNYKELSIRAHQNAVNHGFWENMPSTNHFMMLVITEVAEMVEGDRKGKKADRPNFEYQLSAPITKHETATEQERFAYWFEQYIKNTVEDEFADVAIRLLDLAGSRQIVPIINERQWQFAESSFTENAFRLCEILSDGYSHSDVRIMLGIKYVERWAAHLGINLEWHIEQKMKYNESRPKKHGKNY